MIALLRGYLRERQIRLELIEALGNPDQRARLLPEYRVLLAHRALFWARVGYAGVWVGIVVFSVGLGLLIGVLAWLAHGGVS